MSLFVDTGIWPLALRRESPPEGPEAARRLVMLSTDGDFHRIAGQAPLRLWQPS